MRRFLTTTFLWILLLPYAFIFLGAASNQLVLIANGGKFPVILNEARAAEVGPSGMLDDTHCLMTPATHLNALADIFDFHDDIESIGDLSLEAGEALASFCPIIWLTIVVRKLYC